MSVKKLLSILFDMLFPKYCLSCFKEGFYVCPECFAKIPIQKSLYCYICGKRSPDGNICPHCKSKTGSCYLNGLLIASDWNNLLVRQMIYEYKYRFIKDLSLPLAQLLIIFLNQSGFFSQNLPLNIDSYVFIPVPLHPRRLAWRGFNQAELLAKHLNEYLKISVVNNLIVRWRYTPPQMDISDKLERIKNISNAFKLNPDFEFENKPLACQQQVRGKIVILIDDVSTTGSTLNECALVLKSLKPKEIWGLVIARG